MGRGEEMLDKRTWVVVGNHGRNPIVASLVDRLESNGKVVYRVNPYKKSDDFESIRDIPGARDIECLNLVVNPQVGMSVIEDAAMVGINNVFIQPGASNPDLIQLATSKGMEVHEGCVLVELKSKL
ncbi:hypothetical protein CYMTET_37220 [Cymbomonas tetramitiformis]|uniref:CoA-binding domain-containing protein n=1 Tax=Cymbomonas tetramitiformis TaxID=36881 RepID=A0AAE0CG63_9CHLO|nr:hypothetical protein CYMTET_37220 [Cymbomonas tetramitiformis]